MNANEGQHKLTKTHYGQHTPMKANANHREPTRAKAGQRGPAEDKWKGMPVTTAAAATRYFFFHFFKFLLVLLYLDYNTGQRRPPARGSKCFITSGQNDRAGVPRYWFVLMMGGYRIASLL